MALVFSFLFVLIIFQTWGWLTLPSYQLWPPEYITTPGLLIEMGSLTLNFLPSFSCDPSNLYLLSSWDYSICLL
jgi:hypothetical protein